MIRLTLFTVLISLISVDSGNNMPHIVPISFVAKQLKADNQHIASKEESTLNGTAVSNGRDKRGASNSNGSRGNTQFQLDQRELARQNQITQQIFANYLERRLFPNRNVSQKIPTIADILPKPKPSGRSSPRGFSASGDNYKNSPGGAQRNRLAAPAIKRQTTSRDRSDDEDNQLNQANRTNDEFDDDGQESLQSVESEQHDQYYGEIFRRDPSENEIDRGKCWKANINEDINQGALNGRDLS